ncbi:MAG: hypothetical protein OFPII_39260 [Osedax symbiont Rs1]|nr:MAG: hypothetical protein OFPII_39260 [Osedax symbiont Rs1]
MLEGFKQAPHIPCGASEQLVLCISGFLGPLVWLFPQP